MISAMLWSADESEDFSGRFWQLGRTDGRVSCRQRAPLRACRRQDDQPWRFAGLAR